MNNMIHTRALFRNPASNRAIEINKLLLINQTRLSPAAEVCNSSILISNFFIGYAEFHQPTTVSDRTKSTIQFIKARMYRTRDSHRLPLSTCLFANIPRP